MSDYIPLIKAIVAMLPAAVAASMGYFVSFVIALRTLLRATVYLLRSIDLALDGRVDWDFVGTMSDFVNMLDSKLDLMAVSALLPKPRGT